jgi:hypothetical protein
MNYDEMLRDAANKLVALCNDPVAQLADLHRRQAKYDARKGNKPRRSRAMAAREGVAAPGVPSHPADG